MTTPDLDGLRAYAQTLVDSFPQTGDQSLIGQHIQDLLDGHHAPIAVPENPQPTESPLYTADDREKDERQTYRVGIVVFTEVKGADELDASHRARIAIVERLYAGHRPRHDDPVVIDLDGRNPRTRGWGPLGHFIRVVVRDVMDVGLAARNGYLYTAVTGRAYPRPDDDDE